MGRGARMAPDRRPEHERHAGAAGAHVGGGQRDAAREPRDHRAEAPGRGQARTPRSGGRSTGNGSAPVALDRAAVAHAAADQREHDVLAPVQRRERADAEGRRVVGDEEDRPRVAAHRSASS